MSTGRGIRAGRAYILLSIRNQTRQGLNQAQRDLNNFALRTAAIGSGLVIGGSAFVKFFANTAKEFSRVEQLLGRFQSVFGKLSQSSGKFADDLGRHINASGLVIRDQLAQFQATFQGFGFEPGQAEVLSQTLAIATQDLIAFDDTIEGVQQATDKLLGGLTGSNVRGVRSFGANVLDTAVKTELLARGLDVTKREGTATEKVLARLAIILRALGRSGVTGQARREVLTLAAQLRGLKAAVIDANAAIGATIGPAIVTFTQNITASIRAVQQFAIANPRAFQYLSLVGPALIGVGAAALTGASGLALFGLAVSGLASAFSILSALVVPGAVIAGLGFAAQQAATHFDSLGLAAKNALDAIRDEAKGAVGEVTSTIDSIFDALEGGQLGLATEIGLTGLEIAFEESFGRVRQQWDELVSYLTNFKWLEDFSGGFGRLLLGETTLQQEIAKKLSETPAIDLPSVKLGKRAAELVFDESLKQNQAGLSKGPRGLTPNEPGFRIPTDTKANLRDALKVRLLELELVLSPFTKDIASQVRLTNQMDELRKQIAERATAATQPTGQSIEEERLEQAMRAVDKRLGERNIFGGLVPAQEVLAPFGERHAEAAAKRETERQKRLEALRDKQRALAAQASNARHDRLLGITGDARRQREAEDKAREEATKQRKEELAKAAEELVRKDELKQIKKQNAKIGDISARGTFSGLTAAQQFGSSIAPLKQLVKKADVTNDLLQEVVDEIRASGVLELKVP